MKTHGDGRPKISRSMDSKPKASKQASIDTIINSYGNKRMLMPNVSLLPAQMVRPVTNSAQQIGGTCGLYSLFMACKGDIPLSEILKKADEVGTNVGEFFDASRLLDVAKACDVNAELVTFDTEEDMWNKIIASGSKGVIIGYSAFDFPNYRCYNTLAKGKKHLLDHWSVIEGFTGEVLQIRDPNSHTESIMIPLHQMFEANQNTENDDRKFNFDEFQKTLDVKVTDLRSRYEELCTRVPGSFTPKKRSLGEGISVDINLKGKMIIID